MKVILQKTAKGLIGSTPDDHAVWLKFKRKLETIKQGQYLRLEFSSPRNGAHHRKLFALLNLINENSEVYDTPEKALVAIKLCTGRFDIAVDPSTGELNKIPHSIAYEAMGQEDFDRFYSQAISAIIEWICPQLDQKTADFLLNSIIEGWS